MEANSIRSDSPSKPSPKSKKPKKPKDFPLSIHKGSGYWCKKVRGRVFYFGKVSDDPKGEEALDLWLADKDDLLAGREPREKSEGLTVSDLASKFLDQKEGQRGTGEISPRTFQAYFATCELLVKTFGKGRVVVDLAPDDFRKLRTKLAAKRKAAVSLRNEITRVRTVFNFGVKERLIPVLPSYGAGFELPSHDTIRRARKAQQAEHGHRMLEAEELRLVIDKATQPMKSMVLLAANTGFGQSDLSALPKRAVDLESGWVNFARVKTGIDRRCPLWPETIKAIREWLNVRPNAKHTEDAGLLFLTHHGQRWVKTNKKGSPADALGQEFSKLLVELKLKRKGLSFYALRHGFETIAGDSADQVAVNAIMGHSDQSMAAHYRERISDKRLQAVVNHVHAWLFLPVEEAKTETTNETEKPKTEQQPVSVDEAPVQLRIVG